LEKEKEFHYPPVRPTPVTIIQTQHQRKYSVGVPLENCGPVTEQIMAREIEGINVATPGKEKSYARQMYTRVYDSANPGARGEER